MSVRTAQLMTTAFRSFFRFLFQKGELQADLAASVPTVADWRLSTVPKYLTPEEVERVLKACDRRTATGRRDYAILLLLARLGLRAGEVVALQLEDINWRAGEILIRGKGLLHDRMPLPADVGEALASYLRRDRPPCQTRRVFVCTRAPRRGFAGPSTLTTIVRRALAPRELTPRVQGSPPASSQPGDFHVALRGDDGRNRRSSSASSPEHNGNLRQGRLRWPALTGSLLADGRCTVKRLEQALNDYLRIRRSLGYRLREPEGLLRNFVAFLQAEACLVHHQATGASLGHTAREGPTRYLGWAFRHRTTLRHLA